MNAIVAEKEPPHVERAELLCLQQITTLVSTVKALQTIPRGARERALAITKLQEAHMWISSSIEMYAASQEQA